MLSNILRLLIILCSISISSFCAASESVYYIHSDHLNTPRVVTDQSGSLVWNWNSDGFGSTPPNEQPTGGARFVFNLRLPGQVFDSETGLYYNYFRDYDPRTGRYVQSDPIGLGGGINTYAYVEGNPLSIIDPEGLAGHHFVPQSLWRDEPLTPETRRVFDRATTGPIPGGHNYGGGHNKYNAAVRESYEKWKTDNGIKCETMSPKQADEFVNQVKQSQDPRIKDFNRRIYMRIISGAMKKIPVRSNE